MGGINRLKNHPISYTTIEWPGPESRILRITGGGTVLQSYFCVPALGVAYDFQKEEHIQEGIHVGEIQGKMFFDALYPIGNAVSVKKSGLCRCTRGPAGLHKQTKQFEITPAVFEIGHVKAEHPMGEDRKQIDLPATQVQHVVDCIVLVKKDAVTPAARGKPHPQPEGGTSLEIGVPAFSQTGKSSAESAIGVVGGQKLTEALYMSLFIAGKGVGCLE